MNVVGLSGAQGGGKTALLNELSRAGYRVDNFKVSRTVQARLGWTSLVSVMSDWDTMTAFQREVLATKLEHDLALRNESGNNVVLVERTFADIAAYAMLWTWELVDSKDIELKTAMKFVTSYLEEAREAQRNIYSGVLLLPLMDHIPWENDPHRASRETSDYVYSQIEGFTKLSTMPRRYTIKAASIADRAAEVAQFLKDIK